MKPFWALRIHKPESGKGAPYAKLQQMTVDDITPGEVVIEVHYSSANYKDALAATGRGPILKRFPLNGGIDASGVVLESSDARFTPGQKVIVTGCGLSEYYDGGYAEILRVQGDSVVPLPESLSLREAMILGTAGFTAALALHRLLENHQRPELGPMLVTGASGGVGSFAVQLLSQEGFEVHAVSGKHESLGYLKKLGATQVIPPGQLELGSRPLESVRFGGAIDNVGGRMLSQLLAHIQLWGNVCSIGLAESAELNATVMPFILRGVSLLGISSNNCPRELRISLWQRLAGPWRPRHLEDTLSRVVELKDLLLALEDIIHRRVQGRILVQIRKDL